MTSNVKLLIGIPTMLEYPPFFESLSKFIKEIDGYYVYDIKFVYKKTLSNAHAEILDCFLKGDYTHLLLLEDDHWGHSKVILDSLFKPDSDVCCVNTFSRQYPYMSVLRELVTSGNDYLRYATLIRDSGYAECDMVGLGMTLYKRSALIDIVIGYDDKYLPYYRKRYKEKNLTFIGCFDHTLPHRNITKDNVEDIRNEAIVKFNQIRLRKFISGDSSGITDEMLQEQESFETTYL